MERCWHGHYCLVSAGRLLHPLTLDVCDLDRRERAMTQDERLFAQHNDAVTTYHTAVRDGSVWWCPRCKRTLGAFGEGMPVTEADCVPHRWGDGAADG